MLCPFQCGVFVVNRKLFLIFTLFSNQLVKQYTNIGSRLSELASKADKGADLDTPGRTG